MSFPPRLKKLICWVRPGVWETRATLLRPVRALISEDLPTLERPTKATSRKLCGGRLSILLAPQIKSHGPAKSFRAVSSRTRTRLAALEILEQVHFNPFLAHDVPLLRHGEQVVPGVIDHQPRRQAGEEEDEDQR